MKPQHLSARILSLLACSGLIAGSAGAVFAVELPHCSEPNCLLSANHEGVHQFIPSVSASGTQNSSSMAAEEQSSSSQAVAASQNTEANPSTAVTFSTSSAAHPQAPPPAPEMPQPSTPMTAPLPSEQNTPPTAVAPTVPQLPLVTPDTSAVLPEMQEDLPAILPELNDTLPDTSSGQTLCNTPGCQLPSGHEGSHSIPSQTEQEATPEASGREHLDGCIFADQGHEGDCLIPSGPSAALPSDQNTDAQAADAVSVMIKALDLPEGSIDQQAMADLQTRYQSAADAYQALSDTQKAMLDVQVTQHLAKVGEWLSHSHAARTAGFLVNGQTQAGELTLQAAFAREDASQITLLENQTISEPLRVTHDISLYGTQDEKSYSITLQPSSADTQQASPAMIEVLDTTLTLDGTYLDGGVIKIGRNAKLRVQKTNVLTQGIVLSDGVKLKDVVEFVDGGSLVISGQTYNKVMDDAFGYTVDPTSGFETNKTDTFYASLQDAINDPDVTEITLRQSAEDQTLTVPPSRTKPLHIHGTDQNFKLGELTVQSPLVLDHVDIAQLKATEFTLISGVFTVSGMSDCIPVYIMNEHAAMPAQARIDKPSAAPIFTPAQTPDSVDALSDEAVAILTPFDGFYYQPATAENQLIKITRNGINGYFTNVNNAITQAQGGESILVKGKIFDNVSIDLGEKNIQLSLQDCQFINMGQPAINIASNFTGNLTMTGSKISFASTLSEDEKIGMRNDSAAASIVVKGNYWGAEKPKFSGAHIPKIQYTPYYNAPELIEENKVEASQDLPSVLKRFEDSVNQVLSRIESGKTLDSIADDWISGKTDLIRAQKNDLLTAYNTLLQEGAKTFAQLLAVDTTYQNRLAGFSKLLGTACDLDRPSMTKALSGLQMPSDTSAQDNVQKALSKLLDQEHPANAALPQGLAASQVGLVSDPARDDYFTNLTGVFLDKTCVSYATVGSGNKTQLHRIFFTVEPKRTLSAASSTTEEQKIALMNGLSKVRLTLPVPDSWHSRVSVRQITPDNRVIDSYAEVLSEKGYAYIQLELSEFGSFELSSNDSFSSNPDKKPENSEKHTSKKDWQERQNDFWEDVQEDIRRAKAGEVIHVNASLMDDFPVDLLRQMSGQDVTLLLDYQGTHAEIYGMDLPDLPKNRQFVGFDELFDLLEQYVEDKEQPDVIRELPELPAVIEQDPAAQPSTVIPQDNVKPDQSVQAPTFREENDSKQKKQPEANGNQSSAGREKSSSSQKEPASTQVQNTPSLPKNPSAKPTRGADAAAAAAGVFSAAALTGSATCGVHFLRKYR